MLDIVFILFVFAFGACIGSFLNVVVWRMPRGESLSDPPSHCPKCNHKLAWYDNIPVFGWIKLAGRCRYCREPISIRYPIVEAVTGGLFVFYYVMFFFTQTGPCVPRGAEGGQRMLSILQDWPIYGLYMVTIAALLAASLIDAELFIIPLEICYFMAIAGVAVHTIIDTPSTPGGLIPSTLGGAMAVGGGIGLLASFLLLKSGKLPMSFPNGEVLEVDRELIQQDIDDAIAKGEKPPEMPPLLNRLQVRVEIGKEMLFLIIPLLGSFTAAIAVLKIAPLQQLWQQTMAYSPVGGFCGALLGALVGAFVVWIVRILGSLAFGRVAMGLGDVHLMFGVGAVLGAGGSTIAFFLAPFFGILYALYRWLSGQGREVPYGPFLGMASALVMLFYSPIVDYLRPGLEGLILVLSGQM